MNEQTQVLIAQLTKQAKEAVDSVAWKEMINLVVKTQNAKVFPANLPRSFGELKPETADTKSLKILSGIIDSI